MRITSATSSVLFCYFNVMLLCVAFLSGCDSGGKSAGFASSKSSSEAIQSSSKISIQSSVQSSNQTSVQSSNQNSSQSSVQNSSQSSIVVSSSSASFSSASVVSAASASVVSSSRSSIALSSSLSSLSSSSFFSLSSSSAVFSSSSSSAFIILSGVVSYDYVPHRLNGVGLNYSAIESRPVRGARIELLDELGAIKAATTTANDGGYAFNVAKNVVLKVRVKAQLLSETNPSWDFKVTDNTANNALYVLEGGLLATGTQSSTRNLHASAGWTGVEYTAVRAAAPFAILDSVYVGLMRILTAGNTHNLSPLEFRWSTKNSVAEGDITKGEIGTSFYDGSAIYILGDANHDTDEYDPHVLLHEWGHYLEHELFRSDSIGGDHAGGDFLDLRVAMSEGFANAFSCMMLDNSIYADASGAAQSSGFIVNVAKKNRTNKGYFNEGSVGSVFFNFYASGTNKTANDFSPIFQILNASSYISSEAFASIFLFQAALKEQLPQHELLLSSLMQEQSIFGVDEYASNESNNGGLAISLPVYKEINSNGSAVNVCSAADYGKYNKLGNSQFLKLNVAQTGAYTIRVNKFGGAEVASKPEFILYQRGRAIAYKENSVSDNAVDNLSIAKGNYVLEVYDNNNRDTENTDANTTCFNVQLIAN